VNESGASIYSASEVARTEFPDLDLTVRGAVSIGRRLMDPLAELVKIDAKSIGVGQYQHDVNQTMLKSSLDRTVESCVNTVGVNLNTASKHLLTYISGLGPALAQNIVNHRTENGLFKNRNELKKVTRLGAKAFEQAAGFLRIRNGAHPLDNTAVHPESYHIVEKMATDLKTTVNQLITDKKLRSSIDLNLYVSEKIGLPTLNDIMKELDKPGLDPRGEAKSFAFAEGIRTLEDLRVGMIVPGIVTNITNFGAFVDIGVKQDGLVHVSQLANRFVRNPNEVVKLQQIVEVKIIELDRIRKRVMLSMKDV
jgi:protein Tex